MTKARFFTFILALAVMAPCFVAAEEPVRMWEEDIVLPTYVAGDPEPNPMFYFGRMSQGAEGRVYPYPLYDTLTGEKVDKTYTLVYLENEYVRIGIMPEIGGRIFEGYDKTNDYHFFYRQHVIKPALIGLIGAWISGGVEWNVPHHHRASTFMPVQYRLEEHPDGSRTIWTGELEVRHTMRWAIGYTLRPGSSLLEVSLRILNRTPVPNTMLCFANVAVHVNEDYQVIFPPSTQWGTHHHKREFTKWPIADGRYGSADFSEGVDISWYKNHEAANSIFAWNYEDDFVAGYDHGKRAGTMAVANHHIVPGKKLWTWGNGPRGRMWDKILTDEDGPYIEIMVGAYSDNQPDYSWLAPYEVKSFDMFWYPFRDIDGVKEANVDAAVNLEVKGGSAEVGFYTTKSYPRAVARLWAGDRTLLEETVAIDPAKPYTKTVSVPAGIDKHDLRAAISVDGEELVSYSPIRLEPMEQPAEVKTPPEPSEIENQEELYLTGQWINQFHNPDLDPEPYWEEALRRDPGDVRVNTELGIRLLKKARYADAEKHFRKALERLTSRHQTPKYADPTYYLGVALKRQGRYEEAFKYLYKATWNADWRDPGYFGLAEIATRRGNLEQALELVDRSLDANAINVRALNLKAALLRHLDRKDEARTILATAYKRTDPLDVRTMAEQWLLSGSQADAKLLHRNLAGHPITGISAAAEYLSAGLWQDGAALMDEMIAAGGEDSKLVAMAHYYRAYFAEQLGQDQKAEQHYALARKASPEYVFPFQPEDERVLRQAMESNPQDARAPYYLGNLLFDWQPDEAVRQWEKSAKLDPDFAIVHRNIAIAKSHRPQGNSLQEAIASLERAVALDKKYPIHFFELDQIYAAAGVSPEKRLERLEANSEVVAQRDDSTSRIIALKVTLGKYDEAIKLMTGREFEVWEGGELNVADYWTDAHLLRGRQRIEAGDYKAALSDFETALEIPSNLPSERMGGFGRRSEAAYWRGVAYEGLGDQAKAKEAWESAATASEQSSRRSRRFGSPLRGASERYYQARSLEKLGQPKKAETIYKELVSSAEEALAHEHAGIDSGASAEEQQHQRARLALAHYAAALGHLGLDEDAKAKKQFKAATDVAPDHIGARTMLSSLN